MGILVFYSEVGSGEEMGFLKFSYRDFSHWCNIKEIFKSIRDKSDFFDELPFLRIRL